MPTDNEIVLVAMQKIQNPRKWTKGGLVKGARMCAWQALREASPDYETLMRIGHKFRLAMYGARQLTTSNFHPLIRFNDHPDTTHEEVIELFKKVADS